MQPQGTVTKTHRIPPKMAAELRALATKQGTSENHEMTIALRAHLDAANRARGSR